jgi:hypothetical protein
MYFIITLNLARYALSELEAATPQTPLRVIDEADLFAPLFYPHIFPLQKSTIVSGKV